MSERTRGVSGGCLCGAVRFEVDFPTTFFVHCHCTLCQRAHGAAYVSWVGVPAAQFRLVAGEGELSHFRSSDHGTRSFCRICGTTLFCRSDRHPRMWDVVAANLDGTPDRTCSGHVYFSDHAPWVDVGDSLPRFGGADGMQPIDEARNG